MYLKALRIENFRGVREASLTFDDTTVLIGENDSGRTSVLEALSLLFGANAANLAESIQPHHFYRQAGIITGPIRLTVHLAETAAGEWKPPARIAAAWNTSPGSPRAAWITVNITANEPVARVSLGWHLRTSVSGTPLFANDPELADWVRRLTPVAWIRGGLITAPMARDARDLDRRDPLLRKVEFHYRNLITGNSPDLAEEIEAGAAAARQYIEEHTESVTGSSPLVGAMASEILGGPGPARVPTGSPALLQAQKLGTVLLLGAISQVAGLELGADSRPVLIVENPESNLHPMTVAAVWQVLQTIRLQKIVTTHSGNLLANCPLSAIRRVTRNNGTVRQHQVAVRRFSREDLRRVSYHVRSRRASAMFARAWLLVEGESEFWIMPELARIMGVDFAAEGVVCVEFAQCGVTPLIKLANQMGIGWHVLTDGDDAGARYSEAATKLGSTSRVTRLAEPDIEHCFWRNGFREIIQGIAYPGTMAAQATPRRQILKAIERSSKPFLALSLVEAAAAGGPGSIPHALMSAVERCLSLARPPHSDGCPEQLTATQPGRRVMQRIDMEQYS